MTLARSLLEEEGRGARGTPATRAIWHFVLLGVAAACALGGVLALRPGVELSRPLGLFDEPARPVSSPAGTGAPPPPLFRITASSLYDAGRQHGRLAEGRIRAWFATDEMQGVFRFVASEEGSGAFAQLKADNEAEFPEYVEELRGIADGSGLPLDQIWCVNMLNEIENLMTIANSKKAHFHCSDVYAISPGGKGHGFAHGHNDDWSDAVKPFWYLVSYTYSGPAAESDKGPGFVSCAGVSYPGAIFGWAPTWNVHGMYATQNTLVPRVSRPGGLACAFAQRRATCTAKTLDDAVASLTAGGWSDGASLNLVDLRGRRMANVELWEDLHSVLEVTDEMGNYSHFNEYKHLQTDAGRPIDDPKLFRTDPRQGRVDSLKAPTTDADVMARLGDVEVFSPHGTITTLVLNGTTGRLNVWCCGQPASGGHPPAHSFDLFGFFGAPSAGSAAGSG